MKAESHVSLIAMLILCCAGCSSFFFETGSAARDVEWGFRVEEDHAVITNLTVINPAAVSCLCIPPVSGTIFQ